MRVTISDVAKAARVSTSTVSRVVANSDKISKETKEKVLKIMEDMNYHPNIIARSLARRSTKILGIIIPSAAEEALQHPFYIEVLRGIGSIAQDWKYNILISSVRNLVEEKEAIREFAQGGIAEGIILLTSRKDDPSIKELKRINFPFVVLGRPEYEKNVNWVDNDNKKAAYDVTEYLISNGHRNIAFFGYSEQYLVSVDRFKGYKEALVDNKIDFNQRVVGKNWITKDNQGKVKEKYEEIIEKERPTAIIGCDDFVAMNAINLVKKMGLEVPKDVCVVGFNNIPIASFITPQLTSVEIQSFELGKKVCEVLIDCIKNKNLKYRKEVVPVKLVIRDSTSKKMLRGQNETYNKGDL